MARPYRDPRDAAARSAPASTSAPITVPTTVRTPSPNILGTDPTRLLLWTFDNDSRLQTLDLDSGELRPLGVRGGIALFPLFRHVVVFDGDNGSSIVSAIGATSVEGLGPGAYSIVERSGRNCGLSPRTRRDDGNDVPSTAPSPTYYPSTRASACSLTATPRYC
ncbi:MAG TPA: hypothetical protein VM282_22355 [Acidimicrobiales bacterium]|nr:hypothetical protein [Acidimicrobiales bacterium]